MRKHFNIKGVELKIQEMLQQKASPAKIALSILIGFALGIMPVPGVTTAFCIVIAFVLGLSQGLTLIVNYAVMPIQILLYYPLIRVGEVTFSKVFFNGYEKLGASLLKTPWYDILLNYWRPTLLGFVAWTALAAVLVSVFYYPLTNKLKSAFQLV